MKSKYLITFFFLLIIIFVGFASASFEIGDKNHSIETTYYSGKNLSGWINMSFDNEPEDSFFNDSLGNNITLINLLELNGLSVYSCEAPNNEGGFICLDFQKLYLDNASFSLPNKYGDLIYQLNFTNSTGTFEIFSENISIEKSKAEIIKGTIEEVQDELSNVKSQIADFDLFTQEALEKTLGIKETEDALKRIQKKYIDAVSDEDYDKIIEELSELSIAKSILITKKADSLLFYPSEKNVDADVLEIVGEKQSSESRNYGNAVLSWHVENIETKITFSEFFAEYEDETNHILIVFEIEAKKKTNRDYPSYLFIKELENMNFKDDYSEESEQGYFVIQLKKVKDKIIFSTTESVEFAELPFFVSPEIKKLSFRKEFSEEQETISRWFFFALLIIAVIILGFAGYLFLQKWYDERYEEHLFRNKEDIHNLMNYIRRAKGKGIHNNEIKERLKKAGWKQEQIIYALKKFEGKITGMPELSIHNLISMFKKGV